MRRLLLCCLAMLCVAAPAQAACTSKSPAARGVSLKVGGKASKGFASFPKRKPTALVVVAHGYSWTAAAWKSKLRLIASGDRAVAVAPEIRGLTFTGKQKGFPRSRGIPLHNSIGDLTAYGRNYVRAWPSVKTV